MTTRPDTAGLTEGEEKRPGGAGSPSPRVLVVEDDAGIRGLLNAVLVQEGYAVETAPNGAVALDLIESRPPSVVLLDLRTPVLDGWSFVQRYRALAGPCAPIVVISAVADAETQANALCVDGFLAKPFDIDELCAVVARCVASSLARDRS